MSGYVSPMQPCIPNKNWRYNESCHLLADTIVELHVFAFKIGLKRTWFQNPKHTLPHYDLTNNKRKEAMRVGAIEIDFKRVSEMIRENRK